MDFREECCDIFKEGELWFKIFSGLIKVSETDYNKLITKCQEQKKEYDIQVKDI